MEPLASLQTFTQPLFPSVEVLKQPLRSQPAHTRMDHGTNAMFPEK